MSDEISPFHAPISAADPTPNAVLLGRVAALLRQRTRRILRSWVSRVGALPTFRERPQLTLDDVLGGVPALLAALTDFVANPTDEEAGLEQALSNSDAHGHGAARAAIGFAAQDVVLEFRLLRQTLWRELTAPSQDDSVNQDRLSAEEIAALQSFVNAYLDSLLASTVTGWARVAAVSL